MSKHQVAVVGCRFAVVGCGLPVCETQVAPLTIFNHLTEEGAGLSVSVGVESGNEV
jgi:hypothetical protein